jgi:CRP/FNR family transcriptional regulator, anaerobic regulatory protein
LHTSIKEIAMFAQDVSSSRNTLAARTIQASCTEQTHGTASQGDLDVASLVALLGMQWTGALRCMQEPLPRKRVRAGQQMIADGENAKALYVVRTGTLKTVALDAQGVSQIVGFPMRGDLVGADGFSDGQFRTSVYALEDCEVIVLTMHRLSALSAQYPGFEHLIYRSMARALVREQDQVWTLGSQCASARLAQFLIRLSAHYADAGYSPKRFLLRMSRTDLANFLGLTVETVSRTLTTMRNAGVMSINLRELQILDFDRLRAFGKSDERATRAIKSPRALSA